MAGKVLQHIGETKLELGPHDAAISITDWVLARDEDRIAWLVLNEAGAGANTIGEKTLRGLDDCLKQVEADPPKALVIRSAKKDGFIAGADIKQFRDVASESEVEAALKSGHEVLDRLERLPCPTICVVHGYALGGGFELALACDYRIAIDGAYFGFPEVRLGLHPGLGGTFRLPALIDPLEAMTMMLTGKSAYTSKAKKLGIADAVVEERHLRNAVQDFANRNKKQRNTGLKARALDLEMLRGVAANRMRSEAAKRAPKEHYPAPYALIDLWEEHGNGRDAMQKGEIKSFAHLLKTETAQNLVRAFFLREHLKGLAGKEHGVRHVHVIGAGTMGAEIAARCAIKGFSVTLFDIAEKPLAAALKKAAAICDEEHLDSLQKRDALDRLVPDPKGIGARAADLVIEAAPEKVDLKDKIYSGLKDLKPDAILATNTSSLSLDELRQHAPDPARFAGLHFFNPVSKLELVEVVSHDQVDEAVMERLRAFAGAISKLPAPVRNYPGFLVNRALTPYLLEAMLMVDEGIAKERIDKAAEHFGMPVGPVELADRVGLDICLHVAESLKNRLDKPFPDTPKWFSEMVERGHTGKKSGKGFYEWKDGKPQKGAVEDDSEAADAEMEDRLILPMLNACMECLRKDVVADGDTLDGAMIFGTGFAPFRGGPMHYAASRGHGDVAENLRRLASKHGKRFEPDQGWDSSGDQSAG